MIPTSAAVFQVSTLCDSLGTLMTVTLTRDNTVAHKIYGIPQTINSANYVYFLAYQELQRIPPRPGEKIEEMVTRRYCRLPYFGRTRTLTATA